MRSRRSLLALSCAAALASIPARAAAARNDGRLRAAARGVRMIVAHRGSSADRPENTLAAYRRAIEAGATAVEIDVRTTRDGALVVLHDPDVDRTTDGLGAVRGKTLEEIRRLDAGIRFHPCCRGERVPTVREVLELCRGRVDVLMDLKERGSDLRVASEVRAARAGGYVILGVHSEKQARWFRRRLPEARQIGLVPGLLPDMERTDGFLAAGVDLVRLWPQWVRVWPLTLFAKPLVARLRARGAGVLVDVGRGGRTRVEEVLACEPTSLMTSDPARLVRTLGEIGGDASAGVRRIAAFR